MTRPQLILIPGLLNDADLWRDQGAELDDVARPVIADITQGESLADLAESVLSLGEPSFALAGFSLGGIVAQEIMRRQPDRVTHLALIGTTMLPDTEARAAKRKRLVAMARSPGKFHRFGEKLLETYLAPENMKKTALVKRVRTMTQRLGPEVFIRQSLIERPDSQAALRQISCPTLVLCGEHDRITPPNLHTDMAITIPTSQLAVIPNCGHLCPIEAPSSVTEHLRTLLARDST